MPTSNFMPDVVVEIAWDGSFRTPMSSWTWTDISDSVELASGLGITWGRGDERSTADANTLTLTLDNSTGDFTAGRSTSAYYPDVVLYKPIRVKATPVDGSESVRFVGYVTSWPVEWEDTDAYAKATITASSRLARLGLNAQWRSLIEENFLKDEPVAYYPLGEPEGATSAADISGHGAPPLVMFGDGDPVLFGQAIGPGTDDLTAATFTGGKYLRSAFPTTSYPAVTLSMFMLRDGVSTSPEGLWSGLGAELTVETTGALKCVFPSGTVDSPSSVCDGLIHHVGVVATASGDVELFVDGVSVDTAPAGPVVALSDYTIGSGSGGRSVPSGVIAHFAMYGTALTGAQLLNQYVTGVTAYAGDATDERLERYANLADIPSAELALDAGSTTMLHVDTSGANVVDMMRLVETTEGGVLFDGRDGLLTFHNRSRRYATASALTLDMAKHEVGADYSPRLDASALVNDLSVVNAAGTASAHKVDAASITANGLATASVTTGSDDPDEPLNMAGWALLQFAEPKPRVPSVTVEALEQVGKTVTCAQVMAVNVGTKITIANHPSQASVSISDYFVEGGTETYGPERLTLTWNVSPSSPDDTAFILGSATRGVLGTNPLAF